MVVRNDTSLTSYFHETLQGIFSGKYLQIAQGIFDIYCQSKDMTDYYNLQGKLDPVTLQETVLALPEEKHGNHLQPKRSH